MAYQTIYKDIGIQDESTWGASVAGNTSVLHVVSADLKKTVNKEMIEETNISNKGRARIKRMTNEISGDISMEGSVRNLHHALEMVMCTRGVTSALGTSALTNTYYQNTTGTMLSKTIVVDRNGFSIDKISGVVANTLTINADNDNLQLTVGTLAKTMTQLSAYTQATNGETVKPFSHFDFTVTIHPGATYGGSALTLRTNNFSIEYDNGAETIYQSTDGIEDGRDPARILLKIPELTGSMEVLHEGSTFVTASYGCSEWYLRFEGKMQTCEGTMAGGTQYSFRVDVPRVQIMTDERNYEQNAFAIETINFTGLFDNTVNGTSTLWLPSLTMQFDNI